jgi:hypothetical protein
MKKAQSGMTLKDKAKKKSYPLLGIETPTPGSENGKRGLPLSKQIQDDIKSGKINKDGSSKTPLKKMGGTVKKAQDGTKFGMLSVKANVDNNPGITAADRISGARMKAGKAKRCSSMMKMGGKMDKQAAVAIAMKKAGKAPKKAMMGSDMMQSSMMKKGGMMKKCKYGCK